MIHIATDLDPVSKGGQVDDITIRFQATAGEWKDLLAALLWTRLHLKGPCGKKYPMAKQVADGCSHAYALMMDTIDRDTNKAVSRLNAEAKHGHKGGVNHKTDLT